MVRLQVVGCFHRSTTVVTHPLPPETRMPGVRSPCPRSYQANQRVAPRIAVDIRGRANYAHNPGKYLEIYHSPFGGIGCSIFGSASVQRILWAQAIGWRNGRTRLRIVKISAARDRNQIPIQIDQLVGCSCCKRGRNGKGIRVCVCSGLNGSEGIAPTIPKRSPHLPAIALRAQCAMRNRAQSIKM